MRGLMQSSFARLTGKRSLPSLQALQDAGVKIINIDSQVKDTDYIDAYVGSDNQEAG